MNFAIIGASGNVGRKTIEILEKSKIAFKDLYLVASKKSAGKKIKFRGKEIIIENLESYDFSKAQITFFAAGSQIAKEWVPKAAKKTIVIDNSSYFRMQADVPLVVPEVNANALKKHNNIISNPNCSTMQMVLALKPLHDEYKIKRVIVSTYQAVSGAGLAGVAELSAQLSATIENVQNLTYDGNAVEHPTPESFPQPIAHNVLAHAGSFVSDGTGETDEEQKLRNESRKILEIPELQVSGTCVRVPVFTGHSLALNLRFGSSISPERAAEILEVAEGVMLSDVPTPLLAAGQDPSYVGRIRRDPTVEHGLAMFIVGDNLRKGAALNAVQIAETAQKIRFS